MSSVLIISESLDVHANEVEHSLLISGVNVLRFNTDRFTQDHVELVFGLGDAGDGVLVNGDFTALSNIRSVLYRRPGVPHVDVNLSGQREFAEKEAQELVKQLYFCLDAAFWVSRYDRLDRARRKYLQLHIASELGMRIPKTLITNSPNRIREFYATCPDGMVYKTLCSPVMRGEHGPELWGVPTTIVTPGLIKDIDLIRPTGGIFQEYVPKSYELRVTVIGRDVFTARIDSQSEPSARTDWREAVAYGRVEVTPYSLPREVQRKCLAVIKWYGLAFGAIDLIRRPDGEYVFLELNPNGQWLWVEELTSQPLLVSMCRLLTTG